MSSLPPVFLDSSHLLTSIITTNSPALSEAKGILMNTFEWFQASTLAALNKDRVIKSLPPILPIGPLEPYHISHDENKDRYRSWLENQPAESVVYISFGNRTAMSRDQIQELEKGLENTGWRFFWVMKDAGLGLWERNWDWGPDVIVKGEEIEKKIVELMTDKKLRARAKEVREEARKAVGRGGSSDKVIIEVVKSLVTPF
ncbi:hypothetical protein NL676_008185 [Syzygium grande]|nr:hypothetical protein NL676_008185 [Syzygium grande]